MSDIVFKDRTYDEIGHVEMTNSDRVMFRGPCLVSFIFVGSDGVAAQVDIYDGDSTLGEHKFRVNVIADDSKPISLPYPTDFDKGVFVDVNAATTFVSIQIHPLKAGKPV